MPKVVYAIVAGPKSPFLDWATVSILLTKNLHKDFPIVLCTDDQTLAFIKKTNHKILGLIDEISCIQAFDGTPRERSRWVKTNIRQNVRGDFIYIDADAIPVGPLDRLYQHDADMAATNELTMPHTIVNWYEDACTCLNWQYSRDHYFNSGIFFLRDSERGRHFGTMWNKKWLQWREHDKSGISADQPSFNSSLIELDVQMHLLPRRYNVFMLHPNVCEKDPRIFHYPASIRPMKYSSLQSTLCRKLANTGEIDWALVKLAQNSGNPWTLPKPLVWAEYILEIIRIKLLDFCRKRIPIAHRKKLVR